MLVFADGVINDPYVFAHFHLSSQVNASAVVDLVTHGVGCGGWLGGGGVAGRNNVPCACKHVSCYAMTSSLALANMFHVSCSV